METTFKMYYVKEPSDDEDDDKDEDDGDYDEDEEEPDGNIPTSASSFRLMVQKPLVQKVVDGLKGLTLRAWCANTITRLRHALRNREAPRLQRGYGHDTIFGWAHLKRISKRVPVKKLLEREPQLLSDTGCADFTPEQYIVKFCSGNAKQLVVKVVFEYLPCSHFADSEKSAKVVTRKQNKNLKRRRKESDSTDYTAMIKTLLDEERKNYEKTLTDKLKEQTDKHANEVKNLKTMIKNRIDNPPQTQHQKQSSQHSAATSQHQHTHAPPPIENNTSTSNSYQRQHQTHFSQQSTTQHQHTPTPLPIKHSTSTSNPYQRQHQTHFSQHSTSQHQHTHTSPPPRYSNFTDHEPPTNSPPIPYYSPHHYRPRAQNTQQIMDDYARSMQVQNQSQLAEKDRVIADLMKQQTINKLNNAYI